MGNHMIRRDTIDESDFRIHSQDHMLNLILLISNSTGKQYTLRKIYKNKTTQEQLDMLKKHHVNVAHLVEYRYDKDNIHLHLLFETPFLTLEALRIQRFQTKKSFTQFELSGIFAQVVQGLIHIRKNLGYHLALKSSNLLIDSQSSIRVTYPLTKTLLNNFSRVKNSSMSYPKQIYLSPYELECISKRVEPKIGYQKTSDIFTLGMIILELGLLTTLQSVYSPSEGIRSQKLNRCLFEFQRKYSSAFTDIVKRSVVLNSDDSPTLDQLQIMLKGINQTKRQYSSSTNSDVYPSKSRQYTIQYFDSTTVFEENDQVTTPRLNSFYCEESRETIRTSEKRLSPSGRKKRLIEESHNLSSVIKTKLENLERASHHLKTYKYSTSHERHNKSSEHELGSKRFLKNTDHQMEMQNMFSKMRLDQYKHENTIHRDSEILDQKDIEIIFPSQENANQEFESGCRIQTESSNQFSFAPNKDRTPTEESLFQVIPNIDLQALDFNNPRPLLPVPSLRNLNKLRLQQEEVRLIQTDRISYSNLAESKYETSESECMDRFDQSVHQNKGNFAHKLKSILETVSPSSSERRLKTNVFSLRKTRQISSSRKISNYDGETSNGLKHGKGKFIFSDGAIYFGEWSLNKMHGMGQLYYASGKLAYNGQWFRDKMQGFGKLYNENPSVKKVNYKNFLTSQNTWFKYEGTLKNDMRHGNGTLFFPTGENYCGQFQNNFIHGEGIFTSKNDKIQGKWQRGELKVRY